MMKPLLFSLSLCIVSFLSSSQNSWVQKANFGGVSRAWANSFSIEDKGYLVGGANSTTSYNDLWEYDQASNAWSQKANFPGIARARGICFSIGRKGYYGNGNSTPNSSSSNFHTDFWEWDQALNTWTQKANSGANREACVSFAINDKGYMGTGWTGGAIVASNYMSDFWQYDPVANAWSQKTTFSGGNRWASTGVSIGSKGYLATGYVASGVFFNDLWEYDQPSDSWTQKANLAASVRNACAGFAIGGKFYLGTGNFASTYYNTFYEYDPNLNSWAQMTNFPGSARNGAVGFSIGYKGYIGTGDYNGTFFNDLWEYSPLNISVWEHNADNKLQVFPNPNQGEFNIVSESHSLENTQAMVYNVRGDLVLKTEVLNGSSVIRMPISSAGVYFLEVITETGVTRQKFVVE